MGEVRNIDFFKLESTVWVANKIINVPTYDFQFSPLFGVKRPRMEKEVTVIARVGAIKDYDQLFEECNDAQESGYCGVKPINLWRNIIKQEKQNLL